MLKIAKWLLLWNFILTLDCFAHSDDDSIMRLGNDSDGDPRMSLGNDSDGDPRMRLGNDSDGDPRMRLGNDSDGDPRMRLGNGTILPEDTSMAIEYGKSVELFCSGDAQNLKMNKRGIELRTVTLNETTVRYLEEKPDLGIMSYNCEDTKTNKGTSVRVFVDTPPLVTGFRCKSKNLNYLNCTWKSENILHEFALYYIENEISYIFVICKPRVYESMYCVWDSSHPSIPYQKSDKTLTFLLETCNGLGCGNQTFTFNHASIIQPDPPKLSLQQKDSHHATIKWEIPWILWVLDVLPMESRISYTYLSIHQVLVNTSSIKENRGSSIEEQLHLPCANTFYEVRVSIKPALAAGDEFWSEDAVITVTTDAEADEVGVAANPMCIKPRVTITPDIMLYEMEKFTDKFKAEQKEIKEKIASMKKKASEEPSKANIF